MAKLTLAAQVAALTEQVAALVAAQAPAVQSPASGKAESPFLTFLREKNARKVQCAIKAHKGACNRRFSPTSAGLTNHVAKLV
jgi:hypothetical protein